MPPTGSRTSVSAYPEPVGVSMDTSAPNLLCELIKIYDDEEIPEVSLGTPVHIEEEKGPANTYSPLTKVQTQEVP
jgi:hypothetical protein